MASPLQHEVRVLELSLMAAGKPQVRSNEDVVPSDFLCLLKLDVITVAKFISSLLDKFTTSLREILIRLRYVLWCLCLLTKKKKRIYSQRREYIHRQYFFFNYHGDLLSTYRWGVMHEDQILQLLLKVFFKLKINIFYLCVLPQHFWQHWMCNK